MCSIVPKSMCNGMFLNYILQTWLQWASLFLHVYFSFGCVYFFVSCCCFLVSAFLDPMSNDPMFVAIMTHVWSNVAFFDIFLTLMLIGSKNNIFCPFFSCLCFLNGGKPWNKFVKVLLLGWVDSYILTKYLNDEDNVISILIIIIWNFLTQSLQTMCKILELYDVNSDIIARFVLVTIPLLQQHMYISIRFLFINRLQFFPYILSWFTVDNAKMVFQLLI